MLNFIKQVVLPVLGILVAIYLIGYDMYIQGPSKETLSTIYYSKPQLKGDDE